jgi:hypothetical protein
MSKQNMIEVRLPKCLVVLTPGEIEYMLRYHPTIWQEALMRGKQVRSTPDSQARTQEYFT